MHSFKFLMCDGSMCGRCRMSPRAAAGTGCRHGVRHSSAPQCWPSWPNKCLPVSNTRSWFIRSLSWKVVGDILGEHEHVGLVVWFLGFFFSLGSGSILLVTGHYWDFSIPAAFVGQEQFPGWYLNCRIRKQTFWILVWVSIKAANTHSWLWLYINNLTMSIKIRDTFFHSCQNFFAYQMPCTASSFG